MEIYVKYKYLFNDCYLIIPASYFEVFYSKQHLFPIEDVINKRMNTINLRFAFL